MKILSSTNGNTKLLLKLALEAVKAAAQPGPTISLVRIPNVSVPKHYLNTSSILLKDAFNVPAHDASVVDDRPSSST